jgi:hypothetical protein
LRSFYTLILSGQTRTRIISYFFQELRALITLKDQFLAQPNRSTIPA